MLLEHLNTTNKDQFNVDEDEIRMLLEAFYPAFSFQFEGFS